MVIWCHGHNIGLPFANGGLFFIPVPAYPRSGFPVLHYIHGGILLFYAFTGQSPVFPGITPESLPWLGHPVALSLNHLLALSYALFLTKLLGMAQYQLRLWHVIKVGMLVLGILQVLAFVQVFEGIWLKSNPVYFMLDTLPALLMGLVLILSTLRSHHKLKPYRLAGQISLYMLAISPLHGMYFLKNLFPTGHVFLNYPPFYMVLGLCTELFCFALALAYQSKLVEVEKNQLQENYARQLENELNVRTRQVQEQCELLEKQHIHQLKQEMKKSLKVTYI